jgi:hypothetical protein
MTQFLLYQLWQFAQWLERPLAFRGRQIAISQGTLPVMPQPADFGGFLYDLIRPSQRDMPMVSQKLHELPTLVNGLEAEL